MKWQNEMFYPEKYENLHGCPLTVGYYNDGTSTITSREIFKTMAQQLNFKLVSYLIPESRIVTVTLDLVEFINVQTHWQFNQSDFTSSLNTDYITFTVPEGEPYTQLEKMFLMFDKPTWICIGATLVAAFVVIQIINFMSIKVKCFVFGQDVRTPSLNVASIFLNGGQHRVPGRNFARFLLMLFIVWSLIIRTCYQSELYKNLQGDLRKPRIQTVDELNEKNFTLVYDSKTTILNEIMVERQVNISK
jgi:hypothetical protein